MSTPSRTRILGLGAALTMAATVTACGEPAAESGTPTSAAVTTSVLATTSAAPTTSAATAPDASAHVPAPGAVLGVVGVPAFVTAPLLAGPGSIDALADIEANSQGLVATGRAEQVDGRLYYEVSYGGVTGWVGSAALAYIGATSDATAEIVARLGGTLPTGSLYTLGELVTGAVAAQVEPAPRVRLTGAPSGGDLGEITYDVLGFPDDSILGVRLHVFGTPSGQLPRSALVRTAPTFTLTSVESTALCRRGVTSDGLCV